MSDSETRRELERKIRSLIPDQVTAPRSFQDAKANGAAAGVGGLFTGYLWGWMRGRRARRAKKKRTE